MRRGDKVYFIEEGKLMRGEYYRKQNGFCIIKKITTKEKYTKFYMVKLNQIARKSEVK